MCWDVRHSSGVLYTLRRESAATNQRVAFDIEPCGRHLATGGWREGAALRAGAGGQPCLLDRDPSAPQRQRR